MFGGALKSKTGVYVNFEQFLEESHNDLYEIMESVGYVTQIRMAGITFLIPPKSFIKDLTDLYNADKNALTKYKKEIDFLIKEGNNPEPKFIGITLVKAFIKALILTMYYPTPESFKSSRAIVNKGYKTYKLEGVTKDKVKLEIGDLTKEDKFELYKEKTGDDRNQVAIWHLSGAPKIDTPRFEQKETTGGMKPTTNCLTGYEVALHIFHKIKEYKKNRIDIEIVYIVTLLEYIKEKNLSLFHQLACVVSHDAFVSLLLILKPGNNCMLVPEELVRDWFKRTSFNIRPNALEAYKVLLNELKNTELSLKVTHNEWCREKEQLQVKLLRDRDLNECDICDLYERICYQWFPIYRNNYVEKINDDVFRAVYQENQCDWDMILPRLKNSDHKIKYHFLNPDFECFGSDRSECLKEFIQSPYFLYCCGCKNEVDRYSSEVREPRFDIDVERLEHLIKLIKGQ